MTKDEQEFWDRVFLNDFGGGEPADAAADAADAALTRRRMAPFGKAARAATESTEATDSAALPRSAES